MTSFDDPHPTSGVSSPGATAETVTVLPPPTLVAPQLPDAGGTIRLLDGLLAGGALALAFLLALLPARNSDVWQHLASGRLLARGQYHFGVDPFAYTTGGVYWVNPSWLYDWLSYGLFQGGGGAALVIAKAALMALLGWMLVRVGRITEDREKSGNGWVAAVFAVLALIIAGSSMPLRSICVSYLFLALTLWLLERGLAGDRPASLVSWWPMPVLFALWANLDAWFLLGPLTVVLYFLGSLLSVKKQRGQTGTLGLVLLVGLAACLLSPHHYRVFAMPELFPLTAGADVLRDDPIFGRQLQSAFQKSFLRFKDVPHLGRLLYYPLVLLGLASFVLNGFTGRSGPHPAWLRRLPAWLGFVALSARDASMLPFFAVVAAPLTALNFQEFARRRAAKGSVPLPRSLPWSVGGRIVTVAIFLGLLIAAWPGWLQGQLRGPRGWFVETDASLVEAVQQVDRWRREGRLQPAETGFNFSPTAAHYFAWFSEGGEKSFCDTRRQLCAAAAPDYITVRRALLGDSAGLEAARRILREHPTAYLVLHDTDTQNTAAVFPRFLADPGEWPLLFLQGDTLVFGWNDPARAGQQDRFADWRLNLHQRAFRPAEDEKAPAAGPATGRNRADWLSFWTTASPVSSHARDEAALYLIYFDLLGPSFRLRSRVTWEHSLAAGIIAGAPGLTDLPRRFLDSAVLQVSRDGPRPRLDGGVWPLDVLGIQLSDNFYRPTDEGPPGLLLLAVRAARRAVKEDPNDTRAYQLLGEAYRHLSHGTRERAWKGELPSLTQIRQAQTAVAFHRGLRLQPDLLQVHFDLFSLYQEMGFLDLALQELRYILRLAPTRGKLLGPDRDAQGEQLRAMEKALDAEVRKRIDRYENQAARVSVLERAVRALDNGLGGKALDVLLASDVAVFGKQGTQIELDLLLAVGRIDEAREWMSPSMEQELGSDAYHRLRLKIEAADGNYEAAEKELAKMTPPLDRPMTMIFHARKVRHLAAARSTPPAEPPPIAYRLQAPPRQVVGLKLGQVLLDTPAQKQSIIQLLTNRLQTTELFQQLQGFAAEIRLQAEVEALRGALALERGEVPQAESFLRRSLAIDQNAGERSAARGMLEWLSRP